MWKLAENAENKSKMENANMLSEMLKNLKSYIPELLEIEVGINHEKADKENWDVCLITEFENWETMEKYQCHPEHLKVADFVKKIRLSRTCVDYVV